LVCLIPVQSLAVAPNDPNFFEQWYLQKIGAENAWDITTGSDSVVVAVFDSGIDIEHPDLKNNIWINSGEIPGNGLDDDKNGYIDDVNGWDFVDDDGLVGPVVIGQATTDAISHGTLIAGLIGAVGDNMKGVVGVNWNVRIMPLRVLDATGAGDSFDVAFAVDYAVKNGADVINFSFSGNQSDMYLREALRRAYEAGVVIVSAIGNEAANVDNSAVYPACYSSLASDWVIGVASTNQIDGRSNFTNFGASCVDISAPGENIFGLSYYDPMAGFPTAYDGGWSGTSMSAPLVSGAVALLLSKYPNLTPEEIETILQLSADPIVGTADIVSSMGPGRLNISRALLVASGYVTANTPAVPEPIVLEPSAPIVQSVILDNFISGQSFDTVYFAQNNERYAVINALTYFTYENSFIFVNEVPDSSLGSYRLSGLVLPKPGVVLIKIKSDPRVYAIEANPSKPFSPYLRAIDSESIAKTMYGNNWADYVIDIEPTFFTKFTLGAPMLSPEVVDTSIMKTRQQLTALIAGQ